MAYETKVILQLLADTVVKSKTLEEAYESIAGAAKVEGLTLPSYKEALETLEERRKS